jgi:iron complex outermembrane recepter protein
MKHVHVIAGHIDGSNEVRARIKATRTKECTGGVAACAAAIFALSGVTAQAQESQGNSAREKTGAEDSVLDEVVVTGYAASLEKAIQDKFEAVNIIDGISSEGIGQFPEQNLAESLQRVTGVQITRNQGQGQFISVRGLDPKFTNTLYNGRQLPSGSGTRAFDYQVLSGDFANKVDVYKSPNAQMLESGLAATVNVQSINPLEYGKRSIVTTVSGMYEEQARDGMSPHLNALYSDTFVDDRLGWVIAVDYNERKVSDQSSITNGVLPDATQPGVYRLFGIVLNDQVGSDKRASVMSKLQFRVNDALELRLDTLASKYDQNYNWLQGDSFYPFNPLGPSTILNQTLDSNNVAVQWTGTNIYNQTAGHRFRYFQELTSSALGAAVSGDTWTFDSEASFGQAREEATNIYNVYASSAPGSTFSYDMTQDPNGPVGFSIADFDTTDPDNYPFAAQLGQYEAPTTDKVWMFKIDASRPLELGWLKGLQIGANYQDRTLATTPNSINTADQGFTDMGRFLRMHQNSEWFDGYHGGAQFPKSWLTVDTDALMAAYPLADYVATHPPTVNLTQKTIVEEESTAAYAQVDFANASGRLTGNAGVRLVRTKEISSGYVPAPDAALILGFAGGTNNITYSDQDIYAQENTYDKVLPNLNLTYRITAQLLTRFAAARVMQRPDMNLLAQSSSPNAATGPLPAPAVWVGTLAKGNPNLKPYLSDQFDLTLEWYFGERSLLAAGFFLKDVDNLILTSYHQEEADVYLSQDSNGVPAGSTLPILFTVGQPQNAQQTTLKGAEVAWQQPFTFLPGFLSNFGAQANYSHIWTDPVVLQEGQPALPVTGVSEDTYNVGIYYDSPKFEMHANYNYRSEWVADPLSYFGDGIFAKGYGQLDISGNYNVTPWLSINASVINATNSASVQVNRFDVNRYYGLSGRQYGLGVRASF